MFLVLACNIKRIFCRRGMKEAITCMDKLLSKKIIISSAFFSHKKVILHLMKPAAYWTGERYCTLWRNVQYYHQFTSEFERKKLLENYSELKEKCLSYILKELLNWYCIDFTLYYNEFIYIKVSYFEIKTLTIIYFYLYSNKL